MPEKNTLTSSCTARLTLLTDKREFACIETGKNHVRHVFDLGHGVRREYELKVVADGAIASFQARWLET